MFLLLLFICFEIGKHVSKSAQGLLQGKVGFSPSFWMEMRTQSYRRLVQSQKHIFLNSAPEPHHHSLRIEAVAC